MLTLVALGLLGGAVAKSAQLPLQTWLPDAMEGPTPVSALIHAATMVTAGVYLIVRTHVLFELAPRVQDVAAGLGTATLLMAGLIALVQTDIKKVIAYSTMSQIGYMFLGAGIGAYANAMFLLMAHAFFKALLFLGAGIVIHALAGEQDIRKMGGLRKLMPKTWWAMLIGGLALAGMPPLSGFFAKDSILASALAAGTYGKILFAVGIAGAFLTGLYTFRMLFVVFGGEQSAYVQEHPPHASHDRLVELVDGADGRRARGARRDRRLDPVRERVDADHRLARAGREAARRGVELPGGGRQHPRRARRRSGHRPRLVDLLGAPAEGAEARGRSSSTSSTSTSCTTGSSTTRPTGSPASSGGRSKGRSSAGRSAGSRPACARRRARSASSRPASSAPTPSGSPPASPSSSSSSSRSDDAHCTAGSPPR